MPPPSAQAALLVAARKLFLAQGFGATSLDRVRQAANVSNGSLFHFFPTKGHLARALYVAALASFQAALHGGLQGDPDATTGIERLLERHLGWVAKNLEDAQVLVELREATVIDGAQVDWRSSNAEAFDALQRWIAARVKDGTMLDVPFDVWMALVFAPALALTKRWVRSGAKPSRAVRDAMVRAACGALVRQRKGNR